MGFKILVSGLSVSQLYKVVVTGDGCLGLWIPDGWHYRRSKAWFLQGQELLALTWSI
jgi:hypothetical protein